KKALSESFRCGTQATDSTCSGCRAKINATHALGQRRPVERFRNAKSSSTARAWNSTLVRWCHPLRSPNNWQSSMCERRVSGNQLAASPEVNAQATFAGVMPARTCWLAVTYSGSSKLTKSKWRTCAYAANVARNRNTDIQMVCRAGDTGPAGGVARGFCCRFDGLELGFAMRRNHNYRNSSDRV